MNLSILRKNLDISLFISIIYSILYFLYYKVLIFIILYINDDLLFFINPIIKNNNLIDLLSSSEESSKESSEESSEESSAEISEESNEENNKINIFSKKQYDHIKLYWEYDIILKLFNIPNSKSKIINSSDEENIEKKNKNVLNNIIKKPIIYNNLKTNQFKILTCFIFNIYIMKKFNYGDVNHKTPRYDYDIKIINLNNLNNKIILINSLYNNINSNLIKTLFPNHNYLYILYNNKNNEYLYKLIDLNNNFDIIKNKKLIFNRIIL